MACCTALDPSNDSFLGEIVGCPKFGLYGIVEMDESGSKHLKKY
jgi:hypothetical protein|tara:strand:+ start:184 stop:315 length:132 start_codon:yes stop_codon:yes gene_type:complete